jgi:hypothetical protein
MLAGVAGVAAFAAVQSGTEHGTDGPASPPAVQDDGFLVIGPRQGDDIIVTGTRPVLRGGLWRFRRSGTLNYGAPNGRFSQASSLPFAFRTCLPDGELEKALRRASGEESSLLHNARCNDLTLTVGKGRIAGKRSCSAGRGALRVTTDISGRYDNRQMTIMFAAEELHNGHEPGGGPGWNPERPKGYRWQAVAIREGDCPATPVLNQRTAEELVPLLFTPALNYQEFDGIPRD